MAIEPPILKCNNDFEVKKQTNYEGARKEMLTQ